MNDLINEAPKHLDRDETDDAITPYVSEIGGIGERMHNGALVMLLKNDTVLCLFRDEFVTWKVDHMGNAYWGHYHGDNFEAAYTDYKKRIKE